MSTNRWVLIEPHDSLFFRDGRPFNQDDEGAAHIASLFPPSPRTVAQMLRAALAADRGWRGKQWSKDGDLGKELGDGPEDLGKLKFTAPLIVCIRNERTFEPLYPAPLALMGRADDKGKLIAVERLVPGPPRRCDFSGDGMARLPRPAKELGDGWKALDGWYVMHSGMQRFLDGETPDATSFAKLDRLAPTERRVGIARDAKTRRALTGALYATDHRRLAGMKDRVAICSGFQASEGWTCSQRRPFGGEHRFAWIEEAQAPPPRFELRVPPGADPVRYLVVTTSPMLPDEASRAPSKKPDPHLPGEVASACIGKPVMLGGWASFAANSGPQPLQPHLPAGSVWFMKASREEFGRNELPESIGQRREFGYGGCVYGVWKDRED